MAACQHFNILTRDSDQHLPHRTGPSRTGVIVRVKNGVDNEDTGNSQSHIQHRQGLLAYPGLRGRHAGFSRRVSVPGSPRCPCNSRGSRDVVSCFAFPGDYLTTGNLLPSAMSAQLNLLLLLLLLLPVCSVSGRSQSAPTITDHKLSSDAVSRGLMQTSGGLLIRHVSLL